jgi:hypothetical protein
VRRVWRKRREKLGFWWLPLAWVGVLLVSLLRWVLIYYSFQGRLLFPGIAVVSTLLIVGVGEWVPAGRRETLSRTVAVALLVLAALAPFLSIVPAYAHPEPLAPAQLPGEALGGPAILGAGMAELVGAEVPFQSVIPGEYVRVVLYWRALEPLEDDFLAAVHLLGRGMESVGNATRHPAMGMVPTSLWEPGQVWRDEFHVYVDETATAPSRLLVTASLYSPELGLDLAAVLPGGIPVNPLVVGLAKLVPSSWPAVQPVYPLQVDLDDGVSLLGYDLEPLSARAGEDVALTLYWGPRASPQVDYTVFVHLLNSAGEPVLFGDSPPLGGEYPTSMWSAGESIVDPHHLRLPADLAPGLYRFVVGMYELDSMARLERVDGGGDSVALEIDLQVR